MNSKWVLLLFLALLLIGVPPVGAEDPAVSAPSFSEPSDGAADGGEKFGLAEAQRQAVFRDLAAAEARAVREAAQQFERDPESDGQVVLTDVLRTRYDREVAAKYGLDTRSLVVIEAEGYEKNWPTGLP